MPARRATTSPAESLLRPLRIACKYRTSVCTRSASVSGVRDSAAEHSHAHLAFFDVCAPELDCRPIAGTTRDGLVVPEEAAETVIMRRKESARSVGMCEML